MSNEFTVSLEDRTKWVAGTTAILGLTILILSCVYLFASQRLGIAKDVFEDVVINTWLPIFNSLIAVVLGWVFGKPIVNALAERIRNSRKT